MGEPLGNNNLKSGDVLLYHGTDFISRMIQLFDGSQYSHAAIYDGESVVEAIPDGGIQKRTIAASVEDALYVDIYRYRGDNGVVMGDPECDSGPLLERIGFYVQQGGRYAYEQIILLAFLVATRHMPIASLNPELGKILRKILDSATDKVNELISHGKEPMICSELVYRCYTEAGYAVKIIGVDRLMCNNIQETLTWGVKLSATSGQGDNEAQELFAAAQEFLHCYRSIQWSRTRDTTMVVPDFVTPRDLKSSPNLVRIGKLV